MQEDTINLNSNEAWRTQVYKEMYLAQLSMQKDQATVLNENRSIVNYVFIGLITYTGFIFSSFNGRDISRIIISAFIFLIFVFFSYFQKSVEYNSGSNPFELAKQEYLVDENGKRYFETERGFWHRQLEVASKYYKIQNNNLERLVMLRNYFILMCLGFVLLTLVLLNFHINFNLTVLK